MFNVDMPYTLILDMPVKLGLKLMAPVSSDRMYTEGKLVDYIINKLNGVVLIVTRIDFQSPDPCGIINGCILKTPDSLACQNSSEKQTSHPPGCDGPEPPWRNVECE